MVRQTFKRDDEPVFVYSDRSPAAATVVRKVLKETLDHAGFDKRLYNFLKFQNWLSQRLSFTLQCRRSSFEETWALEI